MDLSDKAALGSVIVALAICAFQVALPMTGISTSFIGAIVMWVAFAGLLVAASWLFHWREWRLRNYLRAAISVVIPLTTLVAVYSPLVALRNDGRATQNRASDAETRRPRTHEEVVDGFETIFREMKSSIEDFDRFDDSGRFEEAKTEASKTASEIAEMLDGSPSLIEEYGASRVAFNQCLAPVPDGAKFFVQNPPQPTGRGVAFRRFDCPYNYDRHPPIRFDTWWQTVPVFLTMKCGKLTRFLVINAVASVPSAMSVGDSKQLFNCFNAHNPNTWKSDTFDGTVGVVENSEWPYYVRAIAGEIVSSLESGMMSLRPH